MLKRLAISNYALIDALDITFPDHLVIITGETGAGKSILLGALSLLLGTRADVTAIKDRDRNCVVEAEFENKGEELILRRVITPQGRSRIFVNDEPASMEDLKSLSAALIDIHSQNSQLLLSDDKFQLSVLDYFSENGPLLGQYSSVYNEYRKTVNALAELDAAIAEQEKNRDYIEFQYSQLKAANLSEGDLESLENEQKQLANAEDIKLNLAAAANALENDVFSFSTQLKEAEQAVSKVAPFVEEVSSLSERLENCRIEIRDIESELEQRAERVNVSKERLDEVDAKLALIYDLLRKHGKTTDTELIALRDSLAAQLGNSLDMQNERAELAGRCQALDAECERLAGELSKRRSENCPKLSAFLQESIRNLEIPFAIFAVEMEPLAERGRFGKDSVKFMFSANGQASIKELSKCASGGEMSRIMLCIKALMARYAAMPTMIFDEIDTGVSGSVADKMGQTIVGMGEYMQVFAITHLPQVASKGLAHFLVYKEVSAEGATTHIKKIEGEERVREIARMLSGSELTGEAIANARVLLK
ncbi:MAG: DNA repair protein RecN [Bacteroidales bacterium]|nr:DNA repair protein RecN [Bacteroidales bacterium]